MTPLEEDTKILEVGLTAYLDEYREQTDIWKILESKAQVVITVAGVFLAATFAFASQAGLACSAKVFAVITLLSLLLALLEALRVLQIAELLMPVDGAAMVKRTRELVDPNAPPTVPGNKYKTVINELTEESEKVLKAFESVNERKRFHLNWAYRLIVASATAATAAAIIQLMAARP
jgi:hypothetical protein